MAHLYQNPVTQKYVKNMKYKIHGIRASPTRTLKPPASVRTNGADAFCHPTWLSTDRSGRLFSCKMEANKGALRASGPLPCTCPTLRSHRKPSPRPLPCTRAAAAHSCRSAPHQSVNAAFMPSQSGRDLPMEPSLKRRADRERLPRHAQVSDCAIHQGWPL